MFTGTLVCFCFRAHSSSIPKATGVDFIKPVYVTPVLDDSYGAEICFIYWLSEFMDDNYVLGKHSKRFVQNFMLINILGNLSLTPTT